MEVAGIEPETLYPETSVTMQDSDFSVEELTEILTEISGTDRQMLSQIVERLGSLSDELKRAVMRVLDRLSRLDSTNFKTHQTS